LSIIEEVIEKRLIKGILSLGTTRYSSGSIIQKKGRKIQKENFHDAKKT